MQQTTPSPLDQRQDTPQREGTGPISQLIHMALRIVPLIAVFSAVGYSLGRLYTESYFRWFGIPETALNFSNPDYLFASFEMTVLGGLYALGLWLSVTIVRDGVEENRNRLMTSEATSDSASKIGKDNEPNVETEDDPSAHELATAPIDEQVKRRVGKASHLERALSTAKLIIGILWTSGTTVFVTAVVPGFYVWLLSLTPSWESLPGLWGMLTGILLAWYALVFSLLLQQPWLRWMVRIHVNAPIIILVFPMVLAAVLLIPYMAQKLAINDAQADLDYRLPISDLSIEQPRRSETETLPTHTSTAGVFNGELPNQVIVVYSSADKLYFALSSDVREWSKKHTRMHQQLDKAKLQEGLNKVEDPIELEGVRMTLEKREKQFHQEFLSIHAVPRSSVLSLVHHVAGYTPGGNVDR